MNNSAQWRRRILPALATLGHAALLQAGCIKGVDPTPDGPGAYAASITYADSAAVGLALQGSCSVVNNILFTTGGGKQYYISDNGDITTMQDND